MKDTRRETGSVNSQSLPEVQRLLSPYLKNIQEPSAIWMMGGVGRRRRERGGGEKVAVTTVRLSWTKCRSLSCKHPPPARHLSNDLRHKDMQTTGDGRCPAAEKEPSASTVCTFPAPASLHAASREVRELRCPIPSKGWLYWGVVHPGRSGA